MLKKLINQKGMTLIELLLAVAILSIVSVPVLNVFVKAVEHRAHTMNQNSANYLAEKYIEREKALHIRPENGISEYIDEGFDIAVTYIDKTPFIEKNPTDIGLITTSSFAKSVLDLDVESSSSIKFSMDGSLVSSLSTDNLDSEFITIIIDEVGTSTYSIAAGFSISGIPAKRTMGNKYVEADEDFGINFKNAKTNNRKYKFKIINKTDKKVEAIITDDRSNLLEVKNDLSTSSGSVKVVSGILTNDTSSSNDTNYYDIIVKVSKNDIEYATLITTISAK